MLSRDTSIKVMALNAAGTPDSLFRDWLVTREQYLATHHQQFIKDMSLGIASNQQVYKHVRSLLELSV